jgi:leucyl-tRNA synthetase
VLRARTVALSRRGILTRTRPSRIDPSRSLPQFDPELTRDETVTVVVQVNGKVRYRLRVPADNSEDANVALALSREPVLGRV